MVLVRGVIFLSMLLVKPHGLREFHDGRQRLGKVSQAVRITRWSADFGSGDLAVTDPTT